jgi:hypothetical protein
VARENFTLDGEVKDNFSDDPSVNAYDRKSFQFNRLAPLVYGNYNPDDGIFLGGGLDRIHCMGSGRTRLSSAIYFWRVWLRLRGHLTSGTRENSRK